MRVIGSIKRNVGHGFIVDLYKLHPNSFRRVAWDQQHEYSTAVSGNSFRLVPQKQNQTEAKIDLCQSDVHPTSAKKERLMALLDTYENMGILEMSERQTSTIESEPTVSFTTLLNQLPIANQIQCSRAEAYQHAITLWSRGYRRQAWPTATRQRTEVSTLDNLSQR